MKQVRLGDVAEFIRGITFKPEDRVPVGSPGSVVCMRTKNIQRDLALDDLISVPDRFVRNETKRLHEGDILVSSANSWELVGKCCFVSRLEFAATAGGFISIVRVKNTTHPRFLYYWLNSPEMQHNARHCGRQTTNISNLDVPRYLDLPFPDLSLAEQHRIAAILDKADAIRRKRQQALALADDFLRSAFLEMFGDPVANSCGWPTVPLQTLIDPLRPITYGILMPGQDQFEGVPYIRVVDMNDGAIKLEQVRKTTAAIANEYKRSTLKPGDVLISIRGHVGRLAIVPPVLDGANITQDTARLAVNKEIACPHYLLRCLESASMQAYMRRFVRGAAVKGLNLGDLKQLPIPVAPPERQAKFTRLSEAYLAKKERQKKSEAEAVLLFASLSQRAFRGEL